MSCLISAANVKIFGKAFHALTRIAEDLYVEALTSGLVFHTVNSSKSAYACFTFRPDFFISYTEDSLEKRKVVLKSCLNAFRSLQNLEKTVEKCLFDLTSHPDYLLIKFFCKHGMVKVYQLNFMNNESMLGTFPSSGVLCTLSAPSKLLQDGIQNFSSSVEEITLSVCSNKVLLKNYVDDEPDPNKVVHTELTLESDEFDHYEVIQDTTITFCLKELKAILNFCEGFNVPVAIKCQTGGRPVIFSISGLREVEVQFVLATLADSDSQSVSSSLRNNSVASQSKVRVKDKTEVIPRNQSFGSSVPVNGNKTRPTMLICLSDDEDDVSNEPQLAEEFDEHIPSTPPHKKFRSMFLGLSQSTFTSMAPDPDEILVANSDDENL